MISVDSWTRIKILTFVQGSTITRTKFLPLPILNPYLSSLSLSLPHTLSPSLSITLPSCCHGASATLINLLVRHPLWNQSCRSLHLSVTLPPYLSSALETMCHDFLRVSAHFLLDILYLTRQVVSSPLRCPHPLLLTSWVCVFLNQRFLLSGRKLNLSHRISRVLMQSVASVCAFFLWSDSEWLLYAY